MLLLKNIANVHVIHEFCRDSNFERVKKKSTTKGFRRD